MLPVPAALASPTLPIDDMEIVPEAMERLPLNVLLPVSVKVPVPMETPPPLLLMSPLTRMLPLPAKVREVKLYGLNILPVSVRSPESECMRGLPMAAMFIFPVQVLLPLILRRAPVLPPIPPPESVSASPVTVMLFWSWRDVALPTIVPPAVVPSALLCWMFNTPALIVVLPA